VTSERTASGSGAADPGEATDPAPGRKRPLYPRLLRLRHVHPNAWQRAALGEGALALAVVLVLADLASAWTLLVLPLGVAAIVKAHDLLAGLLRTGPAGGGGPADGSPTRSTVVDRTGSTPADPGDDDGAGPRGGPAPSDVRD
jgi:hypothetical protein